MKINRVARFTDPPTAAQSFKRLAAVAGRFAALAQRYYALNQKNMCLLEKRRALPDSGPVTQLDDELYAALEAGADLNENIEALRTAIDPHGVF